MRLNLPFRTHRRRAGVRRGPAALGAAVAALGVAVVLGSSAASTTSSLAYRAEVLADGPVAYWRLGEAIGPTAADEVGARAGTYSAGTTLGEPGVIREDPNTAVSFNGTQGSVTVPHSAGLNASSGVTVEAWAKRAKNGAYQVIVGKPGNGQSKFENYSLWFDTSNRVQGFFGDGVTYVTVTSPALDGSWHHLVATYDNATARMYVDGVLVASKAATVQLTPNAQALNIGRATTGQYFFQGVIDEVAIYDRALPAARIAVHYQKALEDSTPPAVTLAQPAPGSLLAGGAVALSGVAGTAMGDLGVVAVKIYAGPDASGTPVQTRAAAAGAGGAYAVAASPALADGTYSARAEQSDGAGNLGQSTATSFTVDTRAPLASVLSGPSGPTSSSSAAFGFGADEPGATFACRLDGGAFEACSSPHGYAGLADGPHLFAVRATDPAGNVGPAATRSWVVDTVGPQTTITAGPPGTTTETSASFSFVADEPGSTFVCELDAGAPAACTSPRSYAGLAEGGHTFSVRAIDAAGNAGPAASRTWSVSSTAPPGPQATIASGPSGTTNQTEATFQFDADQPGSSFVCELDGGGFSPCNSPRTYGGLADGSHTFRVIAVSAGGTAGPAAARTWTVDATPPTTTINSGVAGSTPATSASFTFVADKPSVTFACRLDGSGYAPCTSPTSYLGLSEGAHTFAVRATDGSGNTGPDAVRAWTVDTIAPTVVLTTPPGGGTATSRPTFAGTAGNAPGDATTVTVDVYAGGAATGTPVQTLTATRQGGSFSVTATTSLPLTTHTARARQSDAAGNVGTSAATTFTVRDPVLIGTGDIASCDPGDGDATTAALLAQYPDAIVYTLGDNAYPNGQPAEYASCYHPTWGAAKARTRPIPGGHDLATVPGGPPVATGYLGYFAQQLAPFGPTATDPTKLYYSYDVGDWHVVMLNAGCYFETPGCNPAAMEEWFRDDLAASDKQCEVAMWHDARWSSGAVHGNQTYVQPLWQIAYEGGVEVVLNSHEHNYERFAPQDGSGNLDTQFGARAFVVGTGGYFLYDLGVRKPNSEVWDNSAYGVLKLTLHPQSYDWQFVPQAGKTFTDTGSGSCHPSPMEPVPGAPAVHSSASATQPHASTALTIARPSGTQPGDLLLAVVGHQGGSIRSMTPPAGWTAVPNTDLFETTNARIHAWYRFAGSSEPASYTFDLTGGGGMALGGGIAAIEGASPFAPINASGGQVTPANQILLPAPSLTTTVPKTLLVYGGAINAPLTFTPPSLMVEHWDVRTAGPYNVATAIASQALAGVGPTGPRSATLSATAKGPAIVIAIAPAP